MIEQDPSFWKHIASFASGHGYSHNKQKGKKPSRGVKGMDRTVTQPGHSEIASSTSYYQCTATSNKQWV